MNTRIYTAILSLLMVVRAAGQNAEFEVALQKAGKLLVEQIDKKSRKKLAVLDVVETDGRASEFSRHVSVQITAELITSKHDFVLVDEVNRTRFIERIRESNSGIFKPEDGKRLGNMSGADTILYGTLSEAGGKAYVNLRVSTIESGEIIGGAKMIFEMTDSDRAMFQRGEGAPTAGAGNRPRAASDKNFMVKKATWSQGPLEFTITNFLVNHNKAQAKVMVRNKSEVNLRVGFDCEEGNSIGQGQAYVNGIPSTTGLNAKLSDSSGTKFYFAGVEGIISADYGTPVSYLSRNADYTGSAAATVRSLSELPPSSDLTATLYFVLPGGGSGVVGRNTPVSLDMNFALEASFWYSEERVGGITMPTRLTTRFDDLRPKN